VHECSGDRRIAYVHLWAGTHDTFLDLLRATIDDARAEDLDAFILDLRDGYGGAWWPYLDPFFPDRERYFATVNHDAEGASEPMRAEPQRNPLAWTRPMAVIINGGTRSGKESLAFQFKKTGRATLLGTTTAGAFTGGLGAFADRDGGYILYLAVQEMRLDDTAIEAVGVSPDIVVADAPEGDPPLAAALDHLGCRSVADAPSA
jgi:carboxyl-terminal processing protease